MRLIPAAAATLLALAGPAQSKSSWREYGFPDQQFAVSLPAPPALATIRPKPAEAGVTETVYVLQQQDCRFEVAVFDLLRAGIDERTAIARAAASLRQKGETSVDIASEVQGHWGRFISFKTADGSRTIAAVYFRNERLYEIEASAPAGTFNAVSSDMVRFQQSLRFTGSPRSRRFASEPVQGEPSSFGGRLYGSAGGG